MTKATKSKSSRAKVQAHRLRLRKRGLRPIQIWVPDVRTAAFVTAAHSSLKPSRGVPSPKPTRPLSPRFRIGIEPLRRGEVWTVSGGAQYAGRPRPAVIIQDNHFDATASITLCAFTSDLTEAPLFRLVIEPSPTMALKRVRGSWWTRSRRSPSPSSAKEWGSLIPLTLSGSTKRSSYFWGSPLPQSRRDDGGLMR